MRRSREREKGLREYFKAKKEKDRNHQWCLLYISSLFETQTNYYFVFEKPPDCFVQATHTHTISYLVHGQ